MLIPIITPSRTPYSYTNSTPSAANSVFFSITFFNESAALRNDTTLTTVGVFADAAATIVLKVGLRNSGTSWDVVVSQSVSHTGSGWEDFTLTTPYYIPQTGTYHLGGYSTATTISGIPSTTRSYKSGDITGTGQTGFTEDSNNCPGFRASGYYGK